MTEVGTLHREDTGTLSTIKTVDPLDIGDVEIDERLPLGFADAIEQWLRDEHGYDYSDVVAKSVGARAESRKKLEMLNVLDPIDFDPKSRIRLEVHVDSSAFEAEMQRVQQIISEMPDLSEGDPPGVARVEKPAWTPPPQMIEKYRGSEPRGDGIPILAEAHNRSLRVSQSTVLDGPVVDENMSGREAPADCSVTVLMDKNNPDDRIGRGMGPALRARYGRARGRSPFDTRPGGAVDWRAEWAAFVRDLGRPLRSLRAWWRAKQAQRDERMGVEE